MSDLDFELFGSDLLDVDQPSSPPSVSSTTQFESTSSGDSTGAPQMQLNSFDSANDMAPNQLANAGTGNDLTVSMAELENTGDMLNAQCDNDTNLNASGGETGQDFTDMSFDMNEFAGANNDFNQFIAFEDTQNNNNNGGFDFDFSCDLDLSSDPFNFSTTNIDLSTGFNSDLNDNGLSAFGQFSENSTALLPQENADPFNTFVDMPVDASSDDQAQAPSPVNRVQTLSPSPTARSVPSPANAPTSSPPASAPIATPSPAAIPHKTVTPQPETIFEDIEEVPRCPGTPHTIKDMILKYTPHNLDDFTPIEDVNGSMGKTFQFTDPSMSEYAKWDTLLRMTGRKVQLNNGTYAFAKGYYPAEPRDTYLFPPACGAEEFDVTLYQAAHDLSTHNEVNLPLPVAFIDEATLPLPFPDDIVPPQLIEYDGQPGWTASGQRIRKIDILPRFISTEVEGWRLHYWMYMDPRIKWSDIVGRMFYQCTNEGGKGPLAGGLSEVNRMLKKRVQKFRTDHGILEPGNDFDEDDYEVTATDIKAISKLTVKQLEYGVWWTIDEENGVMYPPGSRGAGNEVQGDQYLLPIKKGMSVRVRKIYDHVNTLNAQSAGQRQCTPPRQQQPPASKITPRTKQVLDQQGMSQFSMSSGQSPLQVQVSRQQIQRAQASGFTPTSQSVSPPQARSQGQTSGLPQSQVQRAPHVQATSGYTPVPRSSLSPRANPQARQQQAQRSQAQQSQAQSSYTPVSQSSSPPQKQTRRQQNRRAQPPKGRKSASQPFSSPQSTANANAHVQSPQYTQPSSTYEGYAPASQYGTPSPNQQSQASSSSHGDSPPGYAPATQYGSPPQRPESSGEEDLMGLLQAFGTPQTETAQVQTPPQAQLPNTPKTTTGRKRSASRATNSSAPKSNPRKRGASSVNTGSPAKRVRPELRAAVAAIAAQQGPVEAIWNNSPEATQRRKERTMTELYQDYFFDLSAEEKARLLVPVLQGKDPRNADTEREQGIQDAGAHIQNQFLAQNQPQGQNNVSSQLSQELESQLQGVSRLFMQSHMGGATPNNPGASRQRDAILRAEARGYRRR